MSHPTERGRYLKSINSQILKDIEEARIRQLRMAYWNEPSRSRRPSFDIVLSISVLAVIVLTVWI